MTVSFCLFVSYSFMETTILGRSLVKLFEYKGLDSLIRQSQCRDLSIAVM